MTNAALAKHQRLARLERAAGAAFGHAVVEEPGGRPLLARLAALFSSLFGASGAVLHPR